jgi:hypothetical protein
MIGPGQAAAGNWMDAKKPIWWRWPVVGLPLDEIAGACGSSPIASWSEASARTSPLPPGAGGSKKTTLKPWRKEQWCIPEANAAFVARMADRLDLDEEPDAPLRPRVCFDARPCQWRGDRREPRPMVLGHPRRVD